jgi:hypothetical protein
MKKIIMGLSAFLLVSACASSLHSENTTNTVLKPCCSPQKQAGDVLLYIYQDALRNPARASFLNVHLMPLENIGKAVFKISLELDKNQILNNPLLKLSRNHKPLDAADFIQHRGNDFVLSLPDLTKTDVIELAIGWQGARLEQNSAVFELITATQTIKGQWKGWAKSPRTSRNIQTVKVN